MALYSSLRDSTLHFVDGAEPIPSSGPKTPAFRFRPISPVVQAGPRTYHHSTSRVPLSPLALRHHDSLVAPQQLDSTPTSSTGVPPLTDLTSSTVSNELEKQSSLGKQQRSNSKTNSDWESLQIQVKGRTASLLEISDARLLEQQHDVSVVNDVLVGQQGDKNNENQQEMMLLLRDETKEEQDFLTVNVADDQVMYPLQQISSVNSYEEKRDQPSPRALFMPISSRQTTQLSEIHENASEFEEYREPSATPKQDQQPNTFHQPAPSDPYSQLSQPEIRLLKSQSTASTVIIHDYHHTSSVPTSEIAGMPFVEEDEDDDDQDESQSEFVDEDQSLELFRLHMADRIRGRLQEILMDLDDRIVVQKRNLENMSFS